MMSEIQVRKTRGFVAIEEMSDPSGSCNLARITLTPGFEANHKWKVNTISGLMIRVISGSTHIEIEGFGLTFLSSRVQSSIFIPSRVPYRWRLERKHRITFFVFSTPAWTVEQYEDVTL